MVPVPFFPPKIVQGHLAQPLPVPGNAQPLHDDPFEAGRSFQEVAGASDPAYGQVVFPIPEPLAAGHVEILVNVLRFTELANPGLTWATYEHRLHFLDTATTGITTAVVYAHTPAEVAHSVDK
jgi:hypothetical protein